MHALLALLCIAPAFGWSFLGHQVAAQVAQARLSPEANPWHYVNLPAPMTATAEPVVVERLAKAGVRLAATLERALAGR